MSSEEPPEELPLDALSPVFHVADTRTDGDRILLYGDALVPRRALLDEVWGTFHREGYELRLLRSPGGGDVLVVEPTSAGAEGVPWLNVALLLATVVSTLLVGAVAWYYVPVMDVVENPLVVLRAWPFTAAVLGVLLCHELGHYLVGRYHGVDVSLPYVIPFILPFGTMGAIIRMRGRMPDRKALFDVGVAGPLAGLVATVVVTVVGLSLDPMTVPQRVLAASSGEAIVFHNPPLLELIAAAIDRPAGYEQANLTVHPVILGGWVGMFFTVLNLLPVGQLDGGHMVRAMVGKRQETLAALVPLVLFGLAGYLHFVRGLGLDESVGLWAFWGLFASFIAYNGPANPVDESPIGWRRQAVGVFTFAVGALCFLLVPVQLVAV